MRLRQLVIALCLAAPFVAGKCASVASDAPSIEIQIPGYQRLKVGAIEITAIYDGYVPIKASDLHGASALAIGDLLMADFQPRTGDPRTAVIGFAVQLEGRTILIDTGSGTSLGPNTGKFLQNLTAAGFNPEQVDNVFITHLHPDHVSGLLAPDGSAAYPNALVHVATEDETYWLDPSITAGSSGVQHQIHVWAEQALAPYEVMKRVKAYKVGEEVMPGVTIVGAHGHTPGHSAILIHNGKDRILFWGDTVHSPSVQLARPKVTIAIDSDEPEAAASRRRILEMAADQKLWIGAAHLPFPGLGHLSRSGASFIWHPVHYEPLYQ